MSSDQMSLRKHCLLTRLLRTRPLFAASILLLTGCVLGYCGGLPLSFSAVLLTLLLLGALLLRRHRRTAAVLCITAMLPLGMLRFCLAWDATAPLSDQKDALLSGRICEIPEWKEATERTICVLDEISIDGKSSTRKLRLYLRGDPEMLQDVRLGQRISCTAHIWEADTATNP